MIDLSRASPEAIARAFACALVREHGDEASRLADIVVGEVQKEMRRVHLKEGAPT